MKTHLSKNRKKNNSRKFDGEVLTNSDIMERIKQAALFKKSNAKRRLEFEIDDTNNDDGNTDNTPIAEKIKSSKM
jgi:hypothetical protein